MIGRLKLYAALFGLFVTTLLATWLGGRMTGSANAKTKQLKAEIDAHERINDADTGGGATDIERIKRLQHMADKLGD
jgi:hypothetical protein